MHWFPKHGKSMNTFRADVKKLMVAEEKPVEKPTEPTGKLYRVQVGAFSIKANAAAQLKKLKQAGFEGYIV